MNVACFQLDIAWEDKAANFARVSELARSAALAGDSLLVLPEMFATGFSMNVAGLAEPHGGPTESFLAHLARRHGAHVVGGLISAGTDGRGRNEALAFSPRGRPIARYCKMHPFSFAREHEHYAAGQDVAVFECGPFKAALFVCYDLRFPEVFRRAVRRGADLMLVLANWPASRSEHWTALLRARAIENQAYVVGVNRTGRSPHEVYSGGSVVFDPRGRTLAQANEGECVLRADLDAEALGAWRKEFPALADIRDDLTGG
jgi:predicted amidohydrolase